MTYAKMIKLLAARCCYAAGQPVSAIAASARVSPSAVRRWLRQAGL